MASDRHEAEPKERPLAEADIGLGDASLDCLLATRHIVLVAMAG